MILKEKFSQQGNYLFRRRSFVPLIMLPVLFFALRDAESVERVFGETAGDIYGVFCIGVSLCGAFIRCLVIGYTPGGTSGRNTKSQVAQTLNTTGMYSLVRHPLYFGNFLIFLGIVLSVGVWWFVLIAVLSFWVYYERIMFAEEEFLLGKFEDVYLQWANNKPAFFPKLKNWEHPSLPFSVKNVIRREYHGLFVIAVAYSLLDFLKDFAPTGAVEFEKGWEIFITVCVLLYITIYILRKKTKILDVEGR